MVLACNPCHQLTAYIWLEIAIQIYPRLCQCLQVLCEVLNPRCDGCTANSYPIKCYRPNNRQTCKRHRLPSKYRVTSLHREKPRRTGTLPIRPGGIIRPLIKLRPAYLPAHLAKPVGQARSPRTCIPHTTPGPLCWSCTAQTSPLLAEVGDRAVRADMFSTGAAARSTHP